jgi:hypothetical protein
MGFLDRLSGEGDADEEGADRRRDIGPLGETCHEKRQAEYREQRHLVGTVEDEPPQLVTVEVGERERGDHESQRHPDGDQRARGAGTESEHAERGKEHCHGQVLEDEDREDHRCLPVTAPAEIVEHLGDDTGGRDIGDATHEQGGNDSPAEYEPGEKAWSEVEDEIQEARPGHRPHPGDQLTGGVLETQHQQEEDHTELGTDRDELVRGHEWEHASFTKGEPGEEIEGYRRDPETAGQPSEDTQDEDDRPQFDQDLCAVIHLGQPDVRISEVPLIPSGVPTTTSVSLGSITKSGPGAG